MRVFIVTLGTRGDLELFLTLARQLRRRGHEVLFGTSGFYRQNVEDADVQWIQVGRGSYDELQALLFSLRSVPDLRKRALYFSQRWLQPQRGSAIETITRTGETSDYFISNMKFALAKGQEAMPCAFVTYDPPERVEDLARYGSAQHGGRIIEIVAMNRQIIDPLNRWDPRYQFTGFWRERHLPEWQPPQDLLNFLGAGPPPLVVTMGSMMMFDPQRLARLMIDALRASGQRGVIVGAWSGLDLAASGLQDQSANQIWAIREAPYDWLFPRASCVIHHGGVGTVAAVLAAGVPSIILPQVLCQLHFGQMLQAQNLAAAVIAPDQLGSQGLARAITSALGDSRYRSAARQWQEKMAAEDGVASAADLIELHAGRLNSYVR